MRIGGRFGYCLVVSIVALCLQAFPAASQQKGGILNWFDYGDPGRLDVHTESPLSVQQATAGVYSSLLQYSPEDPSKIVPDLAVSYEASEDGTVYTFALRKGVKWHDGKPFTADDVKATYDRLTDPKVKSRRCGSLVRPLIKSVSVSDPHTVVFKLNFPAATFIPSVASAWCRIAAKHVLEKYGDLQSVDAQIGTGPFKFKRYERGSVIEWERNNEYYNPKLPYLDGVKQYVIVGAARQLAAAKVGQIHLWETWPPMSASAAKELKATRGDEIELYTWPISTVNAVFLNAQKPPFDNKDIRRAVHLALDRNDIFEKGYEGLGTPCAVLDPKVYGEFALSLEEVRKIPGCRDGNAEDIAAAKELVAKHYPQGVDFQISVRSVSNHVDIAQLVAAQLKKIGLRATIKTYESAAGYAAFGKQDFQMIASQTSAMYLADPSGMFSFLYTKGAGRNWSGWNDPKINELADAALKELDQEKRVQIYHRMQRYLLTEDSPTVVIGWLEGWFFRDRKLKNYTQGYTVYDNITFSNVWLEK